MWWCCRFSSAHRPSAQPSRSLTFCLTKTMPVCAVCSCPALSLSLRCKSVSYCTPSHQKKDWGAHKKVCSTLALETQEFEKRVAQEAKKAKERQVQDAHDAEELLLRITTCLAQNGYHTEVGVMVQLNKTFWHDEQIWDAFKDVCGAGGLTRLMYASYHGLVGRVKWLLARGASVNAVVTSDSYTALLFASERGNSEVVRVLCAARGIDVNAATTDDGFTALMWASKRGNLAMVRGLCDRGANLNAKQSTSGGTALAFACSSGSVEVVRELCDRGTPVNDAFMGASLGQTLLMMASQNGHLEVARELLKRGASVNAARAADGFTALMFASGNGRLEVTHELLDRGANVSAFMTSGFTPLMLASSKGHLDIIRLLLQRGADKLGPEGTVAFKLATGPHKAAIQALLKP